MLTTAGMGIKTTTIPIMTSEIVPAVIRGGLVMSFQLFVAFGILMYVAHLFCSHRRLNRS
jgi:type III secretory pathway component EscT